MEPFELYVAFISWGNDGKNRPVLILLVSDELISVYPVTTQYENKSETVRAKYFKINDWSKAGLDKQSYIDTGILLNLPKSVFDKRKPIGKLTDADKKKLLEFLSK
jgi:hypothetical protein